MYAVVSIALRVSQSGSIPGGSVNFEDEDCDVPIAFGDYHLPDGSFCIDRGATSLGPPDDFEGDPRGALPDIGADEHVP